MKKILMITSLLALVLSFSGCFHEAQPTSSSETHLPASTDKPTALHTDLNTVEPQAPSSVATEPQTPTLGASESQAPTEQATLPSMLNTAEISTPSLNPTESLSSAEPPAPTSPPRVGTMDFESVSDLHAFIRNPLERLQKANEEMQNEYEEMCRNFVANGIYSIESTTAPSTNFFVLFPLAKGEDRGISYYFWYKDQVIQTVVYEMKTISNQPKQERMKSYIEERFGFTMESTDLQNTNELFLEAPLLQKADRTVVFGMLDENHYLVIRTDLPKELLLEFMKTLVVEKIKLDESLSEKPSDLPIETHWFGSIRDLETFVTTLSKNPVDYRFRPIFGFEALSTFTLEDFSDYQPIERYFPLNRSSFQEIKGGIGSIKGTPFIKYSYVLDDTIGINICQVEADDITGCYARRDGMEITNYTSSNTLQNGHLLRESTDCDAIYYKEHGVIREVHFLIGNTYIQVFGYISLDDDLPYEEKIVKVQEEILTNPKYACFAALFSEDDETFNNTLAKIKAVK